MRLPWRQIALFLMMLLATIIGVVVFNQMNYHTNAYRHLTNHYTLSNGKSSAIYH